MTFTLTSTLKIILIFYINIYIPVARKHFRDFGAKTQLVEVFDFISI